MIEDDNADDENLTERERKINHYNDAITTVKEYDTITFRYKQSVQFKDLKNLTVLWR